MAGDDFTLSAPSIPSLRPYEELPLRDSRRRELFSFLAGALASPNEVAFEQDATGLRWTWLDHVALNWKIDLPNREIDVVNVWDR